MNNEFEQLIDEIYKRYDEFSNLQPEKVWNAPVKGGVMLNEEFFSKIKTDKEFAERWGVKIEERELSHIERYWLYNKISGDRCTPDCYTKEDFDNKGIPTKEITITYNDKTATKYE